MNRIRVNLTMLGVVCLAALITPAYAQRDRDRDRDMGRATGEDKRFMFHAAQGGIAEVRLGRLAQDKGTSDRVKEFGRRMESDHSKANDQLKDLAGRLGVALPSDTDYKSKQLHMRLSRLSGPAFDRAYIRAMVADHVEDVNMFKRESNQARNPDLRSWVRSTLPTLQDHLRMAENINSRMIARQYRRMR